LTVGEGIREHERERKKSLKLGGNRTHNLCIRSTGFRDKIHDLDYPPLSPSDVVVQPAEDPEVVGSIPNKVKYIFLCLA